jgi:hypothetical protein
MSKHIQALGIDINPKSIGVLFTDNDAETIRCFCYFTNAEVSQFDMPAQENIENLRYLFTTLNMEATCTSFVLDEVVQGRVFSIAGEKRWLYTLLKSPRGTMPPMNTDISNLPWKVIWRSPEVEVLQLGQAGNQEYCFAIRNEINDADASRLMKNSRAFTNPVSVARQDRSRWGYAYIAAALLVVSTIVGGTLYYTFKQNRTAPVPVVASAKANDGMTAPPVAKCFLLYNHRIAGPFPADVVAEMNKAGLLSAETLCRPESSSDWVKLSEVALLQPNKS